MSSANQAHPEIATLKAFGLGMLDPPQAAEIEQHVVECQECCQTLMSLGEDTFVALVRKGDGGRQGEETIDSLAVPCERTSELPAALADHPRYRIVRLVGRGGMGDVYQAEHKLMNRPVAIKLISRRLVANAAAVERFHREVQAAAKLSHPNIVTAHDAEQAGDVHFLVMEYVEGTDLAEVVKQRGPLPVEQACGYVRQAAAGLQHAHEQGMVHRDIKPHNLMLTADGKIKILDFGLANFATSSAAAEAPSAVVHDEPDAAASQLTRLGTMMGTPDFIAPEQADDAHTADIRADLYSLGCTLYFLLAGNPPFPQGDVMHKLAAHRREFPEPVESVRVDVPAELAEVLRRLLAKSPSERFQTPAEVADALAPFVDRQRSFPPREAKPGAEPKGRSAGLFGVLALSAVAALFFAAVLGVVVYVATDQGTLVIEAEDDSVEIMITRPRSDTDKGLTVRIVDRVTGSQVVRLPSGHYRLMLGERGNEFTLTKEQFVLRRGEKVVARIVRRAGANQPVGAAREINTAERLFTGPDSSGFSIAVSKGGTQALVGHYGRGVSLWDVASGKQIRRFEGPDKAVHSVHFWPDGKHAVAASEDGTIRLWELESGREVRQFEGHKGRIDCLALSRDGSLLLSGSADYGQDRDDSVRLWDAASGNELRRFGEAAKYTRDLVFSHDTRRAYGAVVGLTSVIEWNVASGAVVHRFPGCPTAPISLAVSPSGRLLATGHFARQRQDNRWNDPNNAVVRLWDLQTRSIIRELRGHAGPVGDVAFTPDGRCLLSAATGEHDAASSFYESSDQTVRLWEVETGREVARYQMQERVIQLAVLPDGRSFLTVGDSIRLWRLPEIARPEPVAVAPFNAAEAKQLQQAWADRLRLPVEYPNSLGMKFRLIPPGEFAMGSSDEELAPLQPQSEWFFAKWVSDRRRGEMPQRRVRITRPFYLGAHEVTVADFRRFVEAAGYRTKAERDSAGGPGFVGGDWQIGKPYGWSDPGFPQGDDHPVCNIAWEDAAAFCTWLSSQGDGVCRLPTEAEWEYACRAGTTTRFYTGDEAASLEGAANLADRSLVAAAPRATWSGAWDDGYAHTSPVGRFQPNAFGLFDMHGNASEWCLDWLAEYDAQGTVDPQGAPAGEQHVFRGGAFDNWAGFARSADRYSSHSPTLRTDWAGFRVVLSVESVRNPTASRQD